MALAWGGRVELAQTDEPLVLSRPFAVVGGLAVFLYAPVVAYFAALHGDWAYLYFVPWRKIPSAVDLALVLVSVASVAGGFVIAVPSAIAKRGEHLTRLAAIPAVLAIVIVVLGARRLGVSASYAQFHGDFGTLPIGRSTLGRGVLASWIALSAGVFWALRALRRSA
jgi:hypothetical protein